MKRLASVLVAVSCWLAGSGWAMDFPSALSVAIENVPPGADVAGMGNVWTATPQFSSSNPAVLAMDEKLLVGSSVTGEQIMFSDGPDIDLVSGSLAARVLGGLFQFTYSRAGSEMDKVKKEFPDVDGELGFDRIESLDFQYGRQVTVDLFRSGDKLFAGVGYAYDSSDINSRTFIGTPATTFVYNVKSKTRDHTYYGGLIYQPVSEVTVGAYYAHSRSKTRDSMLSDGSFEEFGRSSGFSDKLRVGAGWQVLPLTFLAVDFQHLNVDGAKKDQWFAGVEQGVIKDFLYFYAGWAGSGPTVGLGCYLKHGGINIGYMRRPFADLDEFLGRSQVVSATVYFNF